MVEECHRTISKQKKSLKFSWETLPFAQIIITGLSQDIVIKADKDGKYASKIAKNLIPWNYELHYQVQDVSWNIFEIDKTKTLVLESSYLNNMKQYTLPKVTKSKKVSKIEKKIEYLEFQDYECVCGSQ